MVKKNPDIVILDVKNVCDEKVAKDGVELARTLINQTSSMVVLTSAHRLHLRNAIIKADYVIENRTLTSTDFIDELSEIVDHFLTNKSKFYRNITFRIGLKLSKGALQGSS